MDPSAILAEGFMHDLCLKRSPQRSLDIAVEGGLRLHRPELQLFLVAIQIYFSLLISGSSFSLERARAIHALTLLTVVP